MFRMSLKITPIFALIVSLALVDVVADVSWTPASDDGPLPLSKKFRDGLRKLCKLLEENENSLAKNKSPEEIAKIRHQCAKLKREDQSASPGPMAGASGALLAVILISAVAWYAIKGRDVHTLAAMPDKAAIEKARKARLNRFSINHNKRPGQAKMD
mmetsp:Transcript_29104/g.51150  ORF Transcript_29104/g.51150 Transcript_29104/m.51150 type:complete len:157 (+) Transcript_29104:54-524(+)